MFNRALTIVLLICISFILGCFPQALYIHKKPDGNHPKYDVIQIPDFKKTDAEWVPLDSVTLIPDMLSEKLLKTRKYKLIDRSSQLLEEKENALLVKGVVTGYDRGCKYCEMIFLGINDKGKGSVSLWIQLIDKSSGKTITDFGVHGRAKEPGHGRSRYIRVVDQISKLINDINWPKNL